MERTGFSLRGYGESMETKKDIRSMNFEELAQEINAIGLPKFRTSQIYSWLHEKGVRDFSEMTNLPAALRATLSENYDLHKIGRAHV